MVITGVFAHILYYRKVFRTLWLQCVLLNTNRLKIEIKPSFGYHTEQTQAQTVNRSRILNTLLRKWHDYISCKRFVTFVAYNWAFTILFWWETVAILSFGHCLLQSSIFVFNHQCPMVTIAVDQRFLVTFLMFGIIINSSAICHKKCRFWVFFIKFYKFMLLVQQHPANCIKMLKVILPFAVCNCFFKSSA